MGLYLGAWTKPNRKEIIFWSVADAKVEENSTSSIELLVVVVVNSVSVVENSTQSELFSGVYGRAVSVMVLLIKAELITA